MLPLVNSGSASQWPNTSSRTLVQPPTANRCEDLLRHHRARCTTNRRTLGSRRDSTIRDHPQTVWTEGRQNRNQSERGWDLTAKTVTGRPPESKDQIQRQRLPEHRRPYRIAGTLLFC